MSTKGVREKRNLFYDDRPLKIDSKNKLKAEHLLPKEEAADQKGKWVLKLVKLPPLDAEAYVLCFEADSKNK